MVEPKDIQNDDWLEVSTWLTNTIRTGIKRQDYRISYPFETHQNTSGSVVVSRTEGGYGFSKIGTDPFGHREDLTAGLEMVDGKYTGYITERFSDYDHKIEYNPETRTRLAESSYTSYRFNDAGKSISRSKEIQMADGRIILESEHRWQGSAEERISRRLLHVFADGGRHDTRSDEASESGIYCQKNNSYSFPKGAEEAKDFEIVLQYLKSEVESITVCQDDLLRIASIELEVKGVHIAAINFHYGESDVNETGTSVRLLVFRFTKKEQGREFLVNINKLYSSGKITLTSTELDQNGSGVESNRYQVTSLKDSFVSSDKRKNWKLTQQITYSNQYF